MKLMQQRAGGGSGPSSPHAHQRSAEECRLQKELTEAELPPSCKLSFPRGANCLTDFQLTISPEEGMYQGGSFLFGFHVPQGYPQDPPSVHCLTKVFHPSIDPEGHTDLPFLRESWDPEACNLCTVIYALCQLFVMPSCADPLNHAAGEMLHQDRAAFAAQVQCSMQQGATIAGVYFPPAQGHRTIHVCMPVD